MALGRYAPFIFSSRILHNKEQSTNNSLFVLKTHAGAAAEAHKKEQRTYTVIFIKKDTHIYRTAVQAKALHNSNCFVA